MKTGILGLPLSGRKTIFKILTGIDAGSRQVGKEPVEGFTEIRDPRLSALREILKPARTARARLYLKLLPGLDGGSAASAALPRLAEDCDVLCAVVRNFKDPGIYHPMGPVDPARDFRHISSELILHDLEFAEKRLERAEKERKAGGARAAKECRLMTKLKASLEEETPLRSLRLEKEETTLLSGHSFLTLKPVVLALNSGENKKEELSLDNFLCSDNMVKVDLSAKLEAELEELPPGEERKELMEAMGISEPAAESLKEAFIKALDMISFFTATGGELSQWLIASGSTAEKAAGKIHSDMERGFIKAEVINYEDLVSAGSEEKAAGSGKKLLKGRDYVLSDGDLLNIRFNV